jgi:hypothetical protein
MSKKTKKPTIQEVFGKNYIVKNGRKLPIYKCLISEEAGLITMIVMETSLLVVICSINSVWDSKALLSKSTSR